MGPVGIALALFLLAGAGPPEVVRLRVPAERAGAWFPPGVELRGMPLREFDALVDAARTAAERAAGPSGPRLLRARHFARWDAGVLSGRSELDVAPAARPGELELAPWTPALDGAPEPKDAELRADGTGRTALAIDAAQPLTVTLRWQLRARAGSRGRGFTLGLPAAALSSIALDLPDGWTPEGLAGVQRGPEPGSRSGRQTWRCDGPGGLADLRLHAPADADDPESPIWVSGPTRIDLSETGARANWRADWALDIGPRGPRRLIVALDPGLELVDVAGPPVDGFEAEAEDIGTRVAVRLKEGAAGPAALTIQALARAPLEGTWAVPSARPVEALWTGGTTTVRLDGTRVLADCRERAGRRVLARPGEFTDARLLTFEASAPGSVADLVFRRPWVDASVDVRGELLLGNAEPRLRCRLAWTVERGRLIGVAVDLPSAWVPDEVRVEGSDEPLAWHPETLPGGAVRVHAVPSSVQLARGGLVLTVSAVARVGGGRGPLSLPRVRPVGARVADELWIARVVRGFSLRPTIARGLAWVDPRLVAERGDSSEMNDALAWRWTDEDAEARVDRERVGMEPSATARLAARLVARRLRLDGRLEVDAGDDTLRVLAVGLTEPRGEPRDWRFVDEATGLPLAARALDAPARAARGLAEAAMAWELDLPASRRGPLALRIHYEGAWGGDGHVPLLVLPARFDTRGTVLVLVDRAVRSTAEAPGLTVLEPTRVEEIDADGAGAYRRAHAVGYSAATGGRLRLRTEALEPLGRDGIVQDAALVTFDVPGAARHHRLTLRLAADQAQALDFTMPPGTELVRLRRDGQPITPTRGGGGALSVALPALRAQRAHCTVTLDYNEPGAAPGLLRPSLPAFVWPCTSFSWTVAAPAPWALGNVEGDLVAADPTPRRTWAERALWPWRAAWTTGASAQAPDEASSVLVELDKRVAGLHSADTTLGEWLTRWDANRWPLVVDRMALAAAGWGPRSRVMPQGAGPSATGAAKRALAPLGLTVVPVGVSLLVTTRDDAPDRVGGPLESSATRQAWERALRQASVWGSDVSDRFQSVTRWRGELTPRTGADEPWARAPFDPRWRTWRFAASGWPGADAALGLRNERAGATVASALALALVGLSVVGRGAPLWVRAASAALVLGVGIEALVAGGEAGVALGAGAVLGGAGALLVWLGRACPLPALRPAAARAPRAGSTVRRRTGSTALRMLWLGGLAVLAAQGALAQSGGLRILALLPYDGPPDLARPPDRVLLRLDDYKRLRALAAAPAVPSRGVSATSARHRVTWDGTAAAMVESEYTLHAESADPAPWRLPVAQARDLSATLDGTPAPVSIQAPGRVGEVFVSGAGQHRLVVRRRVSVRPDERGVGFVLPVSAVADARVRASGRLRGEVTSALGRVEALGGAAEGLLGPADRLALHWPAPEGVEPAPPSTAVDGLLLWDAEPAGDRVRARLTLRNPDGVAALRVRTQRGVSVRGVGIPGRVDIEWQGKPDAPEWVARFEPPLPDGTTVVLEFWRPLAATKPNGDGVPLRELPTVEPLDVRRFAGAFALRRPADWSGRLGPGTAAEPMPDEAFARQWGPLPNDPLTLAGTTRFVGKPSASLRTGPVPTRLAARPEVRLRLGPGRVDLRLSGELVETAGRTDHLEWRVPRELRVVAVAADGLTDWACPTRDRIRLRFDGAPLASRAVRLEGWLPVPSDPLAGGPAAQAIDVPWPRWEGVETEPGALLIAGPADARIEGGTGAARVSPEAAAGPGRPPLAYRVEDPDDLGSLRWDAAPPTVAVLVQSQVTVYPESAEWLAVLRYNVTGGAADAIHVNIPTAWAAHAQVRLAGDSHRLSSETRGETTRWTIRPEHPIWGTERLVVRASLPRSARESLALPDVVPLGRGTADAYLAVVNATARPLTTEVSPGVQPVDYAAGFRDPLFTQPPDGLVGAYHVRKDGWRLRVHPRSAGLAAEGAAAVSLVDVACTAAADGTLTGAASYAVGGDPGPFLPLRVPARCELLGATVDGASVPLLKAASGGWLVPLDGGGPATVGLLFRAATGAAAVPVPDEPARPVVLMLRAPEPATAPRSLEPAGPDRLALERAAGLERWVADALGRFDPGAPREREAMVASLVALELSLRTAERSVIWNLAGRPGDRDERLRRVRAGADSIRGALADRLTAAGLDELLDEARAHAGLADEPAAEAPEPRLGTPLRQLGRPAGFVGTTADDLAAPGALHWSTAPRAWGEAWQGHAAALAVALVVLLAARPVASWPRVVPLALLLLIGALGAAGGPGLLVGGLALAATGRLADDG